MSDFCASSSTDVHLVPSLVLPMVTMRPAVSRKHRLSRSAFLEVLVRFQQHPPRHHAPRAIRAHERQQQPLGDLQLGGGETVEQTVNVLRGAPSTPICS